MISCALTLIAEGAVVDAQSNNITAFNILDQLAGEAFPLLVPKLVFMAVLSRDMEADPATFEARVLVYLNAHELGVLPITVSFADRPRARILANMVGVPITEPGTLRFELQADQRGTLASCDLPVVQRAAPAP